MQQFQETTTPKPPARIIPDVNQYDNDHFLTHLKASSFSAVRCTDHNFQRVTYPQTCFFCNYFPSFQVVQGTTFTRFRTSVRSYRNIQQLLLYFRTPVKLVNILKVVSRSKPGTFDLKLAKNTTITSPLRSLQFRFEDPPELKVQTIDYVNQHQLQYAKVCQHFFVYNTPEEH